MISKTRKIHNPFQKTSLYIKTKMNGEEVYVYHYGTHTNGTRTTNANLFIAVYEATLDEINKRPFYEIA